MEPLIDKSRSPPENGESSEKGGQSAKRPHVEDEVVKAHEQIVANRLGQSTVIPLAEQVNSLFPDPASLPPYPAPHRWKHPEVKSTPASFIEIFENESAAFAEERVKTYDDLRQKVTRYEGALGFDFACTENATDLEIKANAVLQHLKKNDIARFYESAPKKRGYGGQEHPRFYGDHFLSNADLIEQTQLFALCRAMPKGAHLHIHFNANLQPDFLLDIAKGMHYMYAWSNIPLVQDEDFHRCRIQFSIMSEEAVEEKGSGNVYDEKYQGGQVMSFYDFRDKYPERLGGKDGVDRWLQNKLVFQEEEAHNSLQTSEG